MYPKNKRKKNKDDEIIIQSIAILWAIWLQRNRVVFHQGEQNIERTIEEAKTLSTMVINNANSGSSIHTDMALEIRDKPSNVCVVQDR